MKAELKKLPVIIVGIISITVGLNMFLLPHQIASAGVGSIGFLLETALLIDRTLIVWAVNIAMLCLAFIFLERAVFFKTLIGSLIFPIILAYTPTLLITQFFPVALVVGSFLFSLGIFILYQIGASNGGVTVPPLIFKKYFGIEHALGVLLTNIVIIVLNLVILGVRQAVISAISIYLISFFMKKLLQLQTQFLAIKPVKLANESTPILNKQPNENLSE
ncbi:YitT family protein [Enterococcus sp. DIV1298c]|uniref:YitT family protein n=1 Tax=Enterococcus sp. DIV1298c TaxID=2815328 RepID=UPI001A936FD9|nr:YitT family protein [Enterococcus sp. DIV1298c]